MVSSTIRANRMMGANKELMNEKQLKRSGRGAMDWRVDATVGSPQYVGTTMA